MDLILANSPGSIFDLHIHDNLPLPIPSDHYTITFDIVTSQIPYKANGPIHLLNFSKEDYNSLCHFLSTMDFSLCFQSEDIEFIWPYLNTLIKDAIYNFIPTS